MRLIDTEMTSDDPTSLNKSHKKHHDCDDQKNMNISAQCVTADQTQKPENYKNHCNGCHLVFLVFNWKLQAAYRVRT